MKTKTAVHIRYRPIAGYPGYRVGEDGSVWTCWQKRWRKVFGGGHYFVLGEQWRQMTPKPNGSGYLHIGLTRDGKRKHFTVHSLVLRAFVGPQPLGMEACHADDNRLNPSLSNLRWDTHVANIADRQRRERGPKVKGEANPHARLTEADVTVIRQRGAAGESNATIARDYGMLPRGIWRIQKRILWSHVP